MHCGSFEGFPCAANVIKLWPKWDNPLRSSRYGYLGCAALYDIYAYKSICKRNYIFHRYKLMYWDGFLLKFGSFIKSLVLKVLLGFSF